LENTFLKRSIHTYEIDMCEDYDAVNVDAYYGIGLTAEF